MKIGIFVDAYEPYVSGVTTSVKMLVETYKQMGHDVFIVTVNLEDGSFIYNEQDQIIYLPGMKTFGLYDLRLSGFYSRKARKIIESWDLDIIHTHTEFGVGTFARIIRKKLDIPLVHTYHTQYEDYVHYITKGLFEDFGKKVVASLTRIYGDKTLDSLIVPTDKIKKIFRQRYHINRQIHVIPSGIDTAKFLSTDEIEKEMLAIKKKYKINDTDFIIGSVSRIAKEKSLDFLINQMPEIVKKHDHVKLLFIGDGPEIHHLQKLAAKLNVDKNVIFTGLIPYDKVSAYYQIMNVLATASKTETQGLTVVEGLAAIKPIICINDLSFTRTVIDGYNGFVFNNAKEYIEDIYKCIENPKIYKDLCNNARNSIQRYSKEAYASEVLKVYAKTIRDFNKKRD